MAKVYSRVYSHKTGWVLGVIEDHVARPLRDYELEDVVERLDCPPAPRASVMPPHLPPYTEPGSEDIEEKEGK